MKRKILITAASPSRLAFRYLAASNLSGKWASRLLATESMGYSLTYNFILAGDSLAGTGKSMLGEFPHQSGETGYRRAAVQGNGERPGSFS
jgi:hypothetical protein